MTGVAIFWSSSNPRGSEKIRLSSMKKAPFCYRRPDVLEQFTQWVDKFFLDMVMILPQVHLRKPCYDFYFL